MPDLKEIIDKVRPLLEEYAVEKAGIEQQITHKGVVPSFLCDKCPRKDIVRVSKFEEKSQRLLSGLLDWMQANDVKELQSDGEVLAFKSTNKVVENVEGTIPLLSIGGALEPSTKKIIYDYRISVSKLKRKSFYNLLKCSFTQIRMCAHLKRENIKEAFPALVTFTGKYKYEMRTKRVEQLWEEEEETNQLRILCSECYARIDFIGCENSVRREGFIYAHSCPVRRVLLERFLEKGKIRYLTSEPEVLPFRQSRVTFYLPDLRVLLTDTYTDVEKTVEVTKPLCILAFGSKQDILRYLSLCTNVVIFDENATDIDQRLFIFDINIPVEKSTERIVQTIVEKLDRYSSEERGKEHDRLIAAFKRIGQDLGFISQSEIPMKGIRVDLVWLNREGKIEVAIEVETSAQWKKDIITTWETGPKLAVVLTHYKTDKAISDAIQYNLLEYMPHKLLLINYQLKRAYLIEKRNIIKSYELKTVE